MNTTPGRRGRFSTQVDDDLQDRVRAAVRGVRTASGTDYSLVQLVEDALTRHCDFLEDTYHDGKPWPPPTGPLTAGRRLGT